MVFAYAIGVSLLLYGALTGFVGNIFSTFTPTLSLFFDQTKTRDFFVGLNRQSTNFMGHSIGVIALVFTGLIFIHTGEMVIKNNLGLIRLLAYGLDYQNPKQYPLVKSNVRFRLHDNGIVSYAERNSWDVKITVC